MVVKCGSGRWRCGWEVQEQNPRNFPQIGKTDRQEQHEQAEAPTGKQIGDAEATGTGAECEKERRMIVATGGDATATDAGAARRWRRGAAAVRAEGATRGPEAMEAPSSMEVQLIGAMNSEWHCG
jgi:hypothetical protein